VLICSVGGAIARLIVVVIKCKCGEIVYELALGAVGTSKESSINILFFWRPHS
jgi:hypothetical protein